MKRPQLSLSLGAAVFLLLLGTSSVWAGGPLHSGAKSNVSEACDGGTCHIRMVNGAFTADTLLVRPNATVVWTNMDPVEHSVTSGNRTGSEKDIGLLFDSGPELIGTNATWLHRFDATSAGSFSYFCVAHPMMVGKIIVGGEVVPEFPQLAMLILAAGSLSSVFVLRMLRGNSR